MDINTVFYIAAGGIGIVAAEELVSAVTRRAAKAAGAGSTVLRDIKTGTRLIALVLVLSNVLNLTGLSSLFTTLTISGILAVAVSLALQNTLSNVISGLLLFNDGALRLGDTIEYGGKTGRVVRVGLRNTWIKTDTHHLVVISNTSLSAGPLTNHTATERLKRKYAFD